MNISVMDFVYMYISAVYFLGFKKKKLEGLVYFFLKPWLGVTELILMLACVADAWK